MKLSLFWKLMLSFALVVAIGLGAVVLFANQITNRELHQYMMGNNSQGMGQGMPGQGMPGQGMPGQGMPGQGMPGQGSGQSGQEPAVRRARGASRRASRLRSRVSGPRPSGAWRCSSAHRPVVDLDRLGDQPVIRLGCSLVLARETHAQTEHGSSSLASRGVPLA